MSNILWKKYIHLCLPKFKCLPTSLSPPPTNDHMHQEPEQESIYLSQNTPTTTTTTTTNAAALIKNFNSLYDFASASTSKSTDQDCNIFSNSSEDYNSDDNIDFSTLFTSQRFFFSSPGNSNSIIESPEIRTPPPGEDKDKMVTGSVAIQTYSPDPYADFRKSMQEMVEAHELINVKANWDFLHELLLCYLSLNPKHTHKVIVCAFTDLIVSLMSTPPRHSHRKSDVDQYHCATSRLLL